MPDRTRQHEQKQTAQASNSAQQQVGREAGVRQTRDQSRELAQLRDKVAILQQDVAHRHAQERQELQDQHENKRQELAADQAERPEVTEPHAADRMAELNTLDRFQDAQCAQLAQRQQFEQQVCRELAQAIAEVAARQQQELGNLQQRGNEAAHNADRTFDNERQQSEARQQRERALLEATCKKELQALRDNREKAQVQMDQDQRALQRALFDEREGAEHQQALREVLANQEAVQRKLLAERQTLEQQRFQERAQATAKLPEGPQKDADRVQQGADVTGPTAERALDEQRQRLEARHQQEREQIEAYFRAQQALPQHLGRQYQELSRNIDHYQDLIKQTNEFNKEVKELYPGQFGSRGGVKNPDLRLDAHHIVEEEAYKYFVEDFRRLGFNSPQQMPAMAIPYEAHIRSPRTLLDSTKEWKSLTKELKEQIDPAKYETLERLINAYRDYYSETMWGGKLTQFFEELLDCHKEGRRWEPRMAAAQTVADELKAQAAADEFKRKIKEQVLRNQEE